MAKLALYVSLFFLISYTPLKAELPDGEGGEIKMEDIVKKEHEKGSEKNLKQKKSERRVSDTATTKGGWECTYSGQKIIIRSKGCSNDVCYASALCKKSGEKNVQTKLACGAVSNNCPGPNRCADDSTVSVREEGSKFTGFDTEINAR
jgi:hypothetical protein